MSKQDKINPKDQEAKLLAKLDKIKGDISRLKEKRKKEIGALAIKHKLDELEDAQLEKAFAQIAGEYVNVDS